MKRILIIVIIIAVILAGAGLWLLSVAQGQQAASFSNLQTTPAEHGRLDRHDRRHWSGALKANCFACLENIRHGRQKSIIRLVIG